MVLITIVSGVYKPTYNWGAPHCNIMVINILNPLGYHYTGFLSSMVRIQLMEVRKRTIFQAVFPGDIPVNIALKNRPKIYGIGTSNQSVPEMTGKYEDIIQWVNPLYMVNDDG